MYYLGIEIGGTKLQLGLGTGDATLAALWRGTVDPARGGDGIREQLAAAVPALLANAAVERTQLAGVGIGFGGPVDDATRNVLKSHQIAGWDNFPLAAWVEALLDLPAVLGNDADVAGLAEAHVGAGKGLSPIFYITIGSGIGGGLILNGEIYRGCGRGAAEIGHLALLHHDECIAEPTILEHQASGWAIGKLATTGKPDWMPGSKLLQCVDGKRQPITAEQVAEAARAGDPYAHWVLKQTWPLLAHGISLMIALLCPRRIVIGGGVSLMGEQLFFEPLRKLVAERVFAPFRDCYDIVPAALGEAVVVHGAITLARQRLGHLPQG